MVCVFVGLFGVFCFIGDWDIYYVFDVVDWYVLFVFCCGGIVGCYDFSNGI